MRHEYILAIDQGTSSSRAIVFDTKANIISLAQEEFPQLYPADGWVEHDPEAIWSTTLNTAKQAFDAAESQGGKVAAIGITNQRETSVIWDRKTGKTIHNAIVWQDRRTAEICRHLNADNLADEVRQRTGLLLDPYFSASKVAWILDKVNGARQRAREGRLAFGTIDSFLLSRLTGGKVHATDATNASRTSLFNIREKQWDHKLLEIFNVPAAVLPDVRDCAADFGETEPSLFGRPLPILGVVGDQQAAAIGQCCFKPGSIKSTYGTGCFVLINTGEQLLLSKNRLLTTVAYQINKQTSYAIEGSIFIAGAAVQWLRDGLGIISSAQETENLLAGMNGNDGVYMVPAFTGLGAPYWNPDVRGAIFGISRATKPAHFIRAALESVCYQTHDLFSAMAEDGVTPAMLKVDGGMVANNWMVQYLADVLDIPVQRPRIMETTALGAAYMAGLQAGLFSSLDDIAAEWQVDTQFNSKLGAEERAARLSGWRDAVERLIAEI